MSVVEGYKRQQFIDALSYRDGPDCFYCGQIFGEKLSTSLTLDHYVPKAFGGRATIDNLRLACYTCNMQKACLPVEEFINSSWLINKKEWVLRERLMKLGIRPDGKGYWHPKKSIKKVSKSRSKIVLICRECNTVSTKETPLWCFPCVSARMLLAG